MRTFGPIVWLMVLCTLAASPIPLPSYGSEGIDPTFKDIVSRSSRTPHGPIEINLNIGFNTSNGVSKGNGTSTDPYIIEDLDISTTKDGFCIKVTSTNAHFIIRNSTIHSDSSYGIMLKYVSNGLIKDCTLYDNFYGLYGLGLENCFFLNNTFTENYYGSTFFSAYRCVVNDSSYQNNTYAMILDSMIGLISNNTFVDSEADGIVVNLGLSVQFLDNNVSYNRGNGMSIRQPTDDRLSNNILIKGCRFEKNNWSGISAEGDLDWRMTDLKIDSTDFSGNGRDGVTIEHCTSLSFTGNHLSDNEVGLNVSSISRSALIRKNTMVQNERAGLSLGDGVLKKNVTFSIRENDILRNEYGIITNGFSPHIFTNNIVDNEVGIHNLEMSAKGLVYDNYLKNGKNCRFSGSFLWNVSKVRSDNIIGGKYIAGNYWSDYTGEDMDGDGIGDTLIPFGPGDGAPVVYPVNITVEDLSDTTTTTGGTFHIRLGLTNTSFPALQDLGGYVEFFRSGYSFVEREIKMTDDGDDTIHMGVVVDSTSDQVRYNVSCRDMYDRRHFHERVVPVIDTIAPWIVDSSFGPCRTGSKMSLRYRLNDNIGIGNVSYSYRLSMDGAFIDCPYRIETVNDTDYYCFDPRIADNATTFEGILNVTDVNGVSTIEVLGPMDVQDTILPEIVDLNNGTLGEMRNETLRFRIKDNIGLEHAVIDIGFNGFTRTIRENLDLSMPISSITFYVPNSVTAVYYSVMALDLSMNSNYSMNSLPVVRVPLLTVKDISEGSPQTGFPYHIMFDVRKTDPNATIEPFYYFDDGDPTIVRSIDSIYIPMVPPDTRELHYGVLASVSGGRSNRWDFNRTIIDIIPPSVRIDHGPAMTGMDLNIVIDVTENHDLDHENLSYKLGTRWIEVSIANGSSARVRISNESRIIVLKASATDRAGNVGYTELTINVTDVISPSVASFKQYLTYDGRKAIVQVSAVILDNWGIGNVTLLVQSERGSMNHYPDISTTGTVRTDLVIDRSLGDLSFRLEASDGSGNHAYSEVMTLEVEPYQERADGPPVIQYILGIAMVIAFLVLLVVIRRINKPRLGPEE